MTSTHFSAGRPTTSPAFRTRPLSPALGAEIIGIDLREPVSDILFPRILDAWHQSLVVLLRDQHISEDEQVRFAERFGPIAYSTRGHTSRKIRRS